MRKQPAVLIFDGDCDLCQGGKRWVEARALPGAFEFLPCQSEERRVRFLTIPEATCLEAMQLVLPDGRILQGIDAVPEILRRVRWWHWAMLLFRVPGVALAAPRMYAWIARHRYTISCLLAKHAEP